MPDPLRLVATAAEIGMNYAGRRQMRRDASDVVTEVLLLIAAGTFMAAAIAFVFVAIWYYLVPTFGQVGAALIMAGLLILLSVITAVIARAIRRTKQKARPARRDQLEVLIGEATKVVQKNKGSSLLVALLAGLLASERRHDARAR